MATSTTIQTHGHLIRTNGATGLEANSAWHPKQITLCLVCHRHRRTLPSLRRCAGSARNVERRPAGASRCWEGLDRVSQAPREPTKYSMGTEDGATLGTPRYSPTGCLRRRPGPLRYLAGTQDLAGTQALGVNCGGCHAGRGNFASDENPRKLVARQMIELTKAINKQFFPNYTPAEGESRTGRVTCFTCHQGDLTAGFAISSRCAGTFTATVSNNAKTAAVMSVKLFDQLHERRVEEHPARAHVPWVEAGLQTRLGGPKGPPLRSSTQLSSNS